MGGEALSSGIDDDGDLEFLTTLQDFNDADKFGKIVDFLIPCLSPETTAAQRKDTKIMSQKWVNSKFELVMLE